MDQESVGSSSQQVHIKYLSIVVHNPSITYRVIVRSLELDGARMYEISTSVVGTLSHTIQTQDTSLDLRSHLSEI